MKKSEYRDPSGFSVAFEEYRSPTNTPKDRSVIIMPPTGGANALDRSYAKSLAKKGALVKVITGWSGDKEENIELILHQNLHARAVKAIKVVTENIPPAHKVSLMGTSVGGLYSSIAASQIDRLERVLVIGAGITIPSVIVHSDQKAMRDLREKRIKAFGFKSDEEYLMALSNNFNLDPKSLPEKFKSKKLGMVLISKDKTVPTINQQELLRHWSPDVKIVIDSGHFWGIVRAWWSYSNEIENFLNPEPVS